MQVDTSTVRGAADLVTFPSIRGNPFYSRLELCKPQEIHVAILLLITLIALLVELEIGKASIWSMDAFEGWILSFAAQSTIVNEGDFGTPWDIRLTSEPAAESSPSGPLFCEAS